MKTSSCPDWREYLAAIRQGDVRAAWAMMERAVNAGVDVATLYLDVVQPAMREVGRLWAENEMTVADEHLATAVTQSVMAQLYSVSAGTFRSGGPTLLAACADTERHDLGLRMLCDLLEIGGWSTTYLGATVPVESLVAMVQQRQPDVLALSATISPHLPRLRHAIEDVRAAMGGDSPHIIVGGRPFLDNPGLAMRIGADATASDSRLAIAHLSEWAREHRRAG